MIFIQRFFSGLPWVFTVLSFCGLVQIQAADTAPVSAAPSAPVAAVVTAGAPTVTPFETFHSIAERNIFDPNRVARSRSTRTEVNRPAVDTISLVGTMESDKGLIAFFESPVPKFKKVLHAGEPIAEFTVSKITPQAVELTRDGKNFSLQVAQQLRRPAGEDWTVAAVEPPRADPAAGTSPDKAQSGTENATPPIPADASDLVKRLMERRQNQLKE
jgi:hypothetical protein